jgi:hypothetical protein
MAILRKTPRINLLNAASLVTFAIFADIVGAIISLIPGVSILVTIVGWLILNLWFTMLGVGFMDGRRIGTMLASIVVEAMPVLNILPGFTVAVIAIIIMVKSEDKLGIKLPIVSK